MMNQTVESVTASLFREYLYRNNYRSTLEAFDKEVPRTTCSITNRYRLDFIVYPSTDSVGSGGSTLPILQKVDSG